MSSSTVDGLVAAGRHGLAPCLGSIRAGVVVHRPTERRRLEVTGAPPTRPPPAIEHRVVDGPVIAAVDEDGGPGGAHLLARADVDERQGARVVHRRAQVDRKTRRA